MKQSNADPVPVRGQHIDHIDHEPDVVHPTLEATKLHRENLSLRAMVARYQEQVQVLEARCRSYESVVITQRTHFEALEQVGDRHYVLSISIRSCLSLT